MDTAIQALRFRVHDYLLKPILPGQIIESIESAVVSLNSIGDELSEDHERSKRYYQLATGIEMDTNKRLITWQDQSISLTPTEVAVNDPY